MTQQIHKYPRTQHIHGSRLQPGDEDLQAVRFSHLCGRNLVIEEKVDGANAAISFDSAGKLQLQSRGHYLTGGPRERHFDLFKQWANTVADELRPVLGNRYVMYGEWLYAKHTIFYDQLPAYFLEFDILDVIDEKFLSTPRRRELLENVPLSSVPVLRMGTVTSVDDLISHIGHSAFISASNRETLRGICERKQLDPDLVARETDPTPTMEGLYVKVEENGAVVERYKYIRASFLTTVRQSETHWLNRPIVPNQLRAGGGEHG